MQNTEKTQLFVELNEKEAETVNGASCYDYYYPQYNSYQDCGYGYSQTSYSYDYGYSKASYGYGYNYGCY